MRAFLPALLALLLLPRWAGAQVTIQDLGWQVSIQVQKQKRNYHAVERWLFPPTTQVKIRPRVLVTLMNPAQAAERAILLRYAVSARLRRIGSEGTGVWTLPFLLEETHIPNLPGKSSKDIPLPLNRVALQGYLQRMYRAGYWPDAFRVQLLVEPRSGETMDRRFSEKEVAVLWKPSEDKAVRPGAAPAPETP